MRARGDALLGVSSVCMKGTAGIVGLCAHASVDVCVFCTGAGVRVFCTGAGVCVLL